MDIASASRRASSGIRSLNPAGSRPEAELAAERLADAGWPGEVEGVSAMGLIRRGENNAYS